jgi:hypothetical protein
MLDRLAERLEAEPDLVRRGRNVNATLLVEVGDLQTLIEIHHGRIVGMTPGPFVCPTWDFALRASGDEWASFWSPLPPPGHHDLFAMLKRRALRVEGNLRPFMGDLRYFKELLGLLRESA